MRTICLIAGIVTFLAASSAFASGAIEFPRTSARDQLEGTERVRAALTKLTTDEEILALAIEMQPNLKSRSSEVQQVVSTIDPQELRLNGNAKKAKQVINVWIEVDDVNLENQQQWIDVIDKVAGGKQ
jgi:hypothetical protein